MRALPLRLKAKRLEGLTPGFSKAGGNLSPGRNRNPGGTRSMPGIERSTLHISVSKGKLDFILVPALEEMFAPERGDK